MQRPVVLIVDEDIYVFRFLAAALEHAGFTVLAGADPATASADLLIADVSAAAGDLRRAMIDRNPDIRVLFITDPGAQLPGSLEKPFTYTQLIDRVRSLLELTNTASTG